jgi:hypothetical protein
MTTFVIEPHVGPIPIRFGMTPQEVEATIGPPAELLPSPFGNRTELRDSLSLSYHAKENTLVEAVFSPGARVLFHGCDLFSVENLIAFLRKFDDAPQSWVGFVIFVNLGIRLSGFHDADESQKAIAVVEKGHWDDFIEDFEGYES